MLIKPTKYTILKISLVCIAANVFVFIAEHSDSYHEISFLTLMKDLSFFLLLDVVFMFAMLREYKTFHLKNDVLIVSSTYFSFIFKPIIISFSEVEYFKVVKFSFQHRSLPALKVYYKSNRVKKIIFYGTNIAEEFQELLDTIRSKGIVVKIEGDYWS